MLLVLSSVLAFVAFRSVRVPTTEPCSERVGTDTRDGVVTADGVSYIRHFGRIRDRIARLPWTCSYGLNLPLPFNRPVDLLGFDPDGFPVMLARQGIGTVNGSALLDLESCVWALSGSRAAQSTSSSLVPSPSSPTLQS